MTVASRTDAAPPHARVWPKGLPWRLTRPRSTLHELLEVTAQRFPHKAATHFFGATATWSEVATQAGRLAAHLQHACGVVPGERVLLAMQNSPQFVVAALGILRADAVLVPVSPMCVEDEVAVYVEDSGARVAILAQDLWPHYAGLPGRTPLTHLIVATYGDAAGTADDLPLPPLVAAARAPLAAPGAVHWSEAIAEARPPAPACRAPGELALMPYTSGSTGRPKGCMHTHETVMHNVLGAVLWEGIHQDAVALSTAPMFHVTGLVHTLFASVYTGATMVIQPRWDAGVAARLIERYRCTHWANVPTMVVDLLSHPEALRHDVSSLACIFGGGSAMPEAIAQKLLDTCGIAYVEGYGMTETISQTHVNPPQATRKQCLGIPTFDTGSLIVDPDTGRELPPGEPGEIVVRGPQLLVGYWGNDDAYRASWVEVGGRRYFRTGDLGRVDDDGYFYIADRLKRMINAAGFKVWPAEVEATMYRHPAIQECCVIAAPDPRRGETVKLVAVLRPTHRATRAEEIVAWAQAHMAAYKVPRTVEFTDALPRSGAGKIQWRALQEREFR